jgi:hypothetical protein
LATLQNIGAGATLQSLCGMLQGNIQGDRVGDMAFLRRVQITYQIVQANSDLYTDTRIIFFQWFPNTTLAIPVLANILPNTSTVGLYSTTNWQYRDQYRILYDVIHSQSGSTTSLTSTSNINVHNRLINGYKRNLVYTPGTAFGENQIYLLMISDSAATPFPVISYAFRVEYTDA